MSSIFGGLPETLSVANGGTGGSTQGAAALALGTRGSVLLGTLTANMNVTTDQAIAIMAGVTKWRPTRFVLFDASANLTLAAGGVYSAASKGGTAIVAATQVYTALSAATKALELTIAVAGTADYLTAATIFLSLTTAQGSAATATLHVYGDILS